VEQFLARFPDYRKALWLAARSEEEGQGNPSYQGWQWSDVEMHPTRVLKLVIEGIAKINMRTRRATYYLLKESDLVKTVLKSSVLNK
jgi:CRISPR/Cas system-associated exonuclease Cas4 (RecB family)